MTPIPNCPNCAGDCAVERQLADDATFFERYTHIETRRRKPVIEGLLQMFYVGCCETSHPEGS